MSRPACPKCGAAIDPTVRTDGLAPGELECRTRGHVFDAHEVIGA